MSSKLELLDNSQWDATVTNPNISREPRLYGAGNIEDLCETGCNVDLPSSSPLALLDDFAIRPLTLADESMQIATAEPEIAINSFSFLSVIY